MSVNPLLNMPELPEFSKIKPEHIEPAITKIIEDNRSQLESLLDSFEQDASKVIDWQSFVEPFELMGDRLSKAWSPIGHMHGVVNSDELRGAYEQCLPLLSQYSTELGQNKRLFAAYESLSLRDDLTNVQRKIVNDALRDFKLAGVALSGEKQQRYGEIKQRLSELSNKFSNNVLDATMAWHKDYDSTDGLEGLPDSALSMAKAIAEQHQVEGYRLTLDIPCYIAVMSYADDAKLREAMYTAYATRASDQGPNAGEYDNCELIDEILQLRHELAQLLDFDNYAELSLATKMAGSTDEVLSFLTELAEKSRHQAEVDLNDLHLFAREECQVDTLEPWDLAYYSEKLRQHKYSISQEALRPYFPEDKVLQGLFIITEKLFSVTIKEKDSVDLWHPHARFFEIYDSEGNQQASFYIDLYARQHKRGGAWMDSCVDRMLQSHGSLQKPVAYLTCNFSAPVDGKPALFTHDEVVTLFHEFGHGIHHMLTKVNHSEVSGINGVPWDAVELPSQFMENFCWQDESLDLISGHWETGDTLPKDLRDKMMAAKNFQSSMQMLRQLEFSLFDFNIHVQFNNCGEFSVQKVLDEVRSKVSVVIPPSWHRFQHSFTHVFAGGYAAGYYSYKWAEVLSADAFSRFEEEGIFNPEVGSAFKQNILEMGGSKEPMELFTAFRGREPSIDALLRHSGINS